MSNNVKETGDIIVGNANANAGQLAPPSAHGPNSVSFYKRLMCEVGISLLTKEKGYRSWAPVGRMCMYEEEDRGRYDDIKLLKALRANRLNEGVEGNSFGVRRGRRDESTKSSEN